MNKYLLVLFFLLGYSFCFNNDPKDLITYYKNNKLLLDSLPNEFTKVHPYRSLILAEIYKREYRLRAIFEKSNTRNQLKLHDIYKWKGSKKDSVLRSDILEITDLANRYIQLDILSLTINNNTIDIGINNRESLLVSRDTIFNINEYYKNFGSYIDGSISQLDSNLFYYKLKEEKRRDYN